MLPALRRVFIVKWQEFLDYTGAVTYTAAGKNDTTYLGRFTFDTLLDFEGLTRVLTIPPCRSGPSSSASAITSSNRNVHAPLVCGEKMAVWYCKTLFRHAVSNFFSMIRALSNAVFRTFTGFSWINCATAWTWRQNQPAPSSPTKPGNSWCKSQKSVLNCHVSLGVAVFLSGTLHHAHSARRAHGHCGAMM